MAGAGRAWCLIALAVASFPGGGLAVEVDGEETAIVPRNRHGNYIVPGVLGDVVYRRVEGVELSLDAYLQQQGSNRPAVIVVHGGGWTSGSRIARVGQLLEMLTTAGFSWFSIDYRLAPEHSFPAALDDLRAAFEFVRSHAKELRVDPNRIALLGEDAGGQLATLLAAERPGGLAATVSVGGIYDLRPLVGESGLGERLDPLLGVDPTSPGAKTVLAAASPIDRVTEGMAPVMIVHGGADSRVPVKEALRYRDALEQTGVRTRFLEVSGASHDAENWWPVHWGYKHAIVDWLSETLDLEDPEHEPKDDDQLRKNIVFGTFETPDGETGELVLDAWIPAGDGPFAGVILAHGGGWEAGDKVTYLTPILEPLARAGLAWFSIDYRLTPEYRHPQQLADLRRAIRYVRHHADTFRVDPDRLATLGESASGQMVAQLAVEPCDGQAEAKDPVEREPCSVAAVVSFYGVYDFLPLVRDASPRSLLVRLFAHPALDEEGRNLLRRYSPLYHAHEGMPPMLLVHGTNERLWEQGLAFAAKLQEVGVEHELYRLDGAPHGMENWEGRPEWSGYKRKVVGWLERQLK
jgi:alpha-L-fucosidase 2